jgi:hypothetical protein
MPYFTSSFFNYDESGSAIYDESTYFSENSAKIRVISIPQDIFGNGIQPDTFELSGSTYLIKDDGLGNLWDYSDLDDFYASSKYSDPEAEYFDSGSKYYVGNIFYSHGIVILTTSSCHTIGEDINQNPTRLLKTDFRFSSSLTIYEQQYKCTILENEFGSSLNPSLLTSSIAGRANTVYYPFVTSSFFTPYITQVGLYNENTELVAVGKLSFPVPISQYIDTTINVNFDV